MYLLVLVLPLCGAMVAGLFGRMIGSKGAGTVTSGCMVLSATVAGLIFYESAVNGSTAYVPLWRWFDIGSVAAEFELQFDGLTAIMLVVVIGVSALVHVYSIGYMSGDPHVPRFMSYLSLFTFLMVVLVTSNNYVQLFIGWEGVGLCSYLLINYWYTRLDANRSAVKAILINRVGDVGLVLAMVLFVREYGALDYSALCCAAPLHQHLGCISLLLLIGTAGKSAQLGLHTWLPDAMEGPTPVSALIHAATMVTAGVFLLIRSGPLFECAPLALTAVTLLGGLTALFGATTGAVQNDIKKVIAYSTCSQLGYMVMACGASSYAVGLSHLVGHAFFKALLFLSAGTVIHAVNDEQDMRRLGGLIVPMPFTYAMILIGSLSLMGVPFLAGFYSKELVIELMYGRYDIGLAYWLGSLSALLTAYYSVRLIYLTFITDTNTQARVFKQSKEGAIVMIGPLALLAVGSICTGYLAKEQVLADVLVPVVPSAIQWMPLVLGALGGVAGYAVHASAAGPARWARPPQGRLWAPLMGAYAFFSSAWQCNFVINHWLVRYAFKMGHTATYRSIDRGLLEWVGPTGLVRVGIRLTQQISNGQVYLPNYALIMVVFAGVFALVGATPQGFTQCL